MLYVFIYLDICMCDVCLYGWMDVFVCMYVCMYVSMYGLMDGCICMYVCQYVWMVRWMDGQMDGWMDMYECMYVFKASVLLIHTCIYFKHYMYIHTQIVI